MSDRSGIEWTDATWNPSTGCTKVSPGCAHCYIERTPAFRMAGRRFEHGATDLVLHEQRLEQPLHWTKPRRVFVNSLSDLFHDGVPVEFVKRVWLTMARTPQHTYQILTKRPARMRELLDGWDPLPNVWLGVSVENKHFADERIPLLLQTPAAVRFISAEPLLEEIHLRDSWLPPQIRMRYVRDYDIVRDPTSPPPRRHLDWVIVGGESGPGARPFDVAWARLIAHHCYCAGVPVFIKQLGSHPIGWWGDGSQRRLGPLTDTKGGDPAEWPADLCIRNFPTSQEARCGSSGS